MALKERIKSKTEIFDNKRSKTFFECGIYFVLGFLMSITSVRNNLHPFGISLISVSKNKNILFSFLGSVLGYLLTGLNIGFARYFASAILALIGAAAAELFELNERPAFPMTVAFLSDFSSGFIVDFRLASVYFQYIITLCEAVLCAVGAFFFYKSINSGYRRIRFRALPFDDTCCIIISFSILLMNLSSLYIGRICPARAAACAVILLSLITSNINWGIMLTLSLGFSFSISEKGSLFVLGAFMFSYFVARMFYSYSKPASGIAFASVIGFFSVISDSTIAVSLFFEAVIGALIFLLMPSKICEKIEGLNINSAPSDSSLRQSLVLKLRFASTAIAAISESVEEVRERINEITRNENEIKRMNISEEEYIRREIVLEKTNQIRMVASDQFFSIADMLEDLAFEFDEAEKFDCASADRIRKLLSAYDIFPKNISVIEDKFSRMRVEILTPSSSDSLDNPELRDEIGKICSRYFEKGRITNFKDETMLSFFERPNYKIDIGFAQHSAEGKLCGDTVKIINDYKGNCILIISDGMGKGSRAALDGAMGAGLISRLINAGFGFDSALKVVNCALLVKSNDESLATLDIANIDLFTGKCEMLKAGAPASYIIKNRSTVKCELTSMPAGILRGVEFAKRSAVLKLGDSIALMSDGICDIGESWLEETLIKYSDYSAQKKADLILQEALEKAQSDKTDDMSIIIAKLERN